jgi:xylulokinase
MDLLMGIDLGSTSLKAIVYDTEGNAIASGSRRTEKRCPDADHPDWVVWLPEEIWGGVADACRDAIAQIRDPSHIRGVAVTGMGMDGLPIDEAGQWLYPMISWHDPRTGPQHAWWLEHITAEKTFGIAGNPVWAINSALRMLWIKEHEPEIYARTYKWLLIEDFLNYMLCDRAVTDHSMASCTMLFDQRTRDWSSEMIHAAGINPEILCEIQASGAPIGEVSAAAAERTGLAEGTPVVLGGHDHLCGALPVGVFEPGTVLNVTGTWETVIAPSAEPVLKDELRQSGMTIQAHVARDRHATWGGNVAADMLEWYRREYGAAAQQKADADGTDIWRHLMNDADAAQPGADGVLFLPHMSGVTCPVVDDQSRGAFVNLTNRTTAGDMTRALIEGLNYQTLDIVTAMEDGLGVSLDRLIGVGGVTRNEFWMQNKADVMGRPVEVPDVEEATPLGAAILAGIGVGLFADERDAWERVYRPGRTYQPREELTAVYAKRFPVYRQLYMTLKDVR